MTKICFQTTNLLSATKHFISNLSVFKKMLSNYFAIFSYKTLAFQLLIYYQLQNIWFNTTDLLSATQHLLSKYLSIGSWNICFLTIYLLAADPLSALLIYYQLQNIWFHTTGQLSATKYLLSNYWSIGSTKYLLSNNSSIFSYETFIFILLINFAF